MSKRRASGDGALLKWKKDGQVVGWIAVADLGVVDGKRKRQKFYGRTQDEVRIKLGEVLAKKRAGTLPKPGRLTVADWLTTWLKGLDKRPRTIEHYELNVRRHIVPLIGSKSLGKLTASDVEAMLARLRDPDASVGRMKGLAPRSVHHVRAILRNSLKKAVRNRLIPYNVAAEADAPKVPQEEMKTLDAGQVRQLLDAVKGSPLEAFFVLAVGLGMREGELLGLRWSDIDLDRGILHVARSLQWVRAKDGDHRFVAALVEPKSRSSRRALPLSGPAIDALRDHRARWRDQKLALGERWLNEWDLVFVGGMGEPLNPKTVWRMFRPILAKAGLPTIRFHDLRHTAGTLMRDKLVDVKVIQETLGHSSIGTTLDTYGHVTPGMRELGVGAQAAILGA